MSPLTLTLPLGVTKARRRISLQTQLSPQSASSLLLGVCPGTWEKAGMSPRGKTKHGDKWRWGLGSLSSKAKSYPRAGAGLVSRRTDSGPGSGPRQLCDKTESPRVLRVASMRRKGSLGPL